MTSKTPNEIANMIINELGAKISTADKFFIYHRLEELQPPAMPTCSTCDYRQADYNESDEWDFCSNKKSLMHYSAIPYDDMEFGCTHHSALEVKDE